MTIKMRPLGSRLVIEPIEQEDITAGGIVLPETAKEKPPQKGTVLAIGPGERNDAGERIPMDVKVGEVVLYAKYSGTEIKYDGKNCSFCARATCSLFFNKTITHKEKYIWLNN